MGAKSGSWSKISGITPSGSYDVLVKCPLCGHSLRKTDAIEKAGLFFVWCPNSRCRWCKLFANAIVLNSEYLYYYSEQNRVVMCMVDVKQVGAVVLVKKKEAGFEKASGIKIFPCRSDGSPDFSKPSQILWKSALDALLRGEGNPISKSGDVSKGCWVPTYENLPLVKNTTV